MRGRKPGEPDGKKVFADAERPVRKRFGDGVDSRARAGFCAVRSESDSSCQKRGGPAPFTGDARGNAKSENGRGGRANEGVKEIPDCVEVRNFVGEKFEDVEANSETENDGVRENA